MMLLSPRDVSLRISVIADFSPYGFRPATDGGKTARNRIVPGTETFMSFMHRMPLTFLASILFLFISGCATTQSGPQPGELEPASLEAAENAYFQLDVHKAIDIYERLLRDPATPKRDQTRALRHLARIEWKFHKDGEIARDLLRKALELGDDLFEAYGYLSRIEMEAGNYTAARQAVRNMEMTARSKTQQKTTDILFAASVLGASEGTPEIRAGKDEPELREAMTRLSRLLDEEPGESASSKLLLGIALRCNHGPMALKAWRSYYHLPANESAEGVMAEPCETLCTLLPAWQDRPLKREECRKLAFALADSGFFHYAAETAAAEASADDAPAAEARKNETPLMADPRIREIVLYSRFLENVKEKTNEYYRLTALEEGSMDDFQSQCDALARAFWKELCFSDERPEYSDDLFKDTLRERFGTLINLGYASGYYGLAMGHVVVDDRRTLTQYGQEAELGFIAIDHMVSNFYTSWFWDGAAAVGGWATVDTIIQVSEAYATGPFEEWRFATDPVERTRFEKEIREKSAKDDALARKNRYAYLPGLDLRLQLAGLNRILKTVDDQGFEGSERCLAFVAEYKRIKLAYSIFAHEGRHAIDQRMHPERFVWWKLSYEGFNHWDQDEKEFRAKLSEIAFSPDPKLAFCHAVFNRNMGDATGHGTANLRVVQTIVDWMEKHKDEIKGLDKTRPLLPQLDRLTDEQIREAIRTVDPLAAHPASSDRPAVVAS